MSVIERSDLPPLNVGAPSRRAFDAAETLLEAYYYQDRREAHLLRGNADQARNTQSRAEDRMGESYRYEFPTVREENVEKAGVLFMRALFLQDEIENWPMLLGAPNRNDLAKLLQSDFSDRYGAGGSSDPRWSRVRSHLIEACDLLGIDDRYADKQTQFWRLHGQLKEYWEEVAIEAHTIKLDAMVPDLSSSVATALGEYFVAGVKVHDQWEHRSKEQDLDHLIEPVAKYYQKLFDLKNDGR